MRKRAIGKHLRHGAVVTTTILGLVGSQSGMAQPAPNAAPSEGAQPAPPSSAAQAATKDGRWAPTAVTTSPPRRSSTSLSSSAKIAPSIMSSPPTNPSPEKRCGTCFRRGSSSRMARRARAIRRACRTAARTTTATSWRRRRPLIRRCPPSRSAARTRRTAVS